MQLLGYRTGWARVQFTADDLVGPWTDSGDGPFHTVAFDTRVSLCGVECIHFDGQTFTARPGHCRACLIALRAWTTGTT
jgi:hypothetical protein